MDVVTATVVVILVDGVVVAVVLGWGDAIFVVVANLQSV